MGTKKHRQTRRQQGNITRIQMIFVNKNYSTKYVNCLCQLKRKAWPEDESLFLDLKIFLALDTRTLITYFKSRQKAIANSVEQQSKRIATTGKRSIISRWLRNKAVAHRTIRRDHTRLKIRQQRLNRRKIS